MGAQGVFVADKKHYGIEVEPTRSGTQNREHIPQAQDNDDASTTRCTYGWKVRSHSCIRNTYLSSLDRLEDSGWYWGPMKTQQANVLLRPAGVGTFLLRDSSDPRYLFSLSVRLERSILNIRVLFYKGMFMFECSETEDWETPKFDCVVKLISYYASISKNNDNRAVRARSDLGDSMLKLEKPLFRRVPTLQHLCRRQVNRTLTPEQQVGLHLGETIETFMRKYPFSI